MSQPGPVRDLMRQSFCIPEPHFTADDIPDLSGKVIIVTGGNSGIGKETVKSLLLKNAKVYIAARSKEKANEAISELKRETRKEPLFLQLDLANLKSVKEAAETFRKQESRLDILFNNGGVMMPPIDQLTADGYDLQFGTNVLGHFYFTKLLLPLLIESAKTSPDGKARVINTSSSAAMFVKELDFDTFRNDGPGEKKRKKLGSQELYSQSKFGNVVFSNELTRRYGNEGILSVSLNPGNIRTDLQRHLPSVATKVMNAVVLHPVTLGAITQLWAGTSSEVLGLNGKFLIPWARVGTLRPASLDLELREKLWSWLEEQVKDI